MLKQTASMLGRSRCLALMGACQGINFMSSQTRCSPAESPAFSAQEFRSFPIKKITSISPNTKALEISLPTPQSTTGMTVASCIMVKGNNGPDGKPLVRPYTPTNLADHKGSFELIIKSYPDGNVSKHLCGLKVGDSVEVKGPFPKLAYTANMKKEIGMIAGGTGITPMLQVIREILRNPADKTKVHLIFANTSEEDILLKGMLDDLVKHHSNFKVTYVLSHPKGTHWTGEKGFVTKALIERVIAKPSADMMVYVCGPPPMMQAISGDKTPDKKQGPLEGFLKTSGYTEEMVFKF